MFHGQFVQQTKKVGYRVRWLAKWDLAKWGIEFGGFRSYLFLLLTLSFVDQ